MARVEEVEAEMKAVLCGGLGAEDAQQLIFEVQRGIPESRSQVEMTPQVRAFRARLAAEMGEAEAKGWFVGFTPEFIAPPR
jgi:hypothetical protein